MALEYSWSLLDSCFLILHLSDPNMTRSGTPAGSALQLDLFPRPGKTLCGEEGGLLILHVLYDNAQATLDEYVCAAERVYLALQT